MFTSGNNQPMMPKALIVLNLICYLRNWYTFPRQFFVII